MLQCNITEPEARVLTRQKGCADGGALRRQVPETEVAETQHLLVEDQNRCPRQPLLAASPWLLNSRKEVIQPQVPLRLPCYDFTPVADLTVVGCLLTVGAPPSGKTNSHGVTGGVYKARERIHRGMLIRDY